MAEGRERKRARKSYRPRLEALEALRLLDAAAPALFAVPIEQVALSAQPALDARAIDALLEQPQLSDSGAADHDEWDRALDDGLLSTDWLDELTVGDPGDEVSIASGLDQLNRYLLSTWGRAGIALQQREDCTQAVHATMLEQVGRVGFDGMLAGIGRAGVSQVLNRDTSLGPDFFRAVDMVKKRAQRQRSFVPLDEDLDVAATSSDDTSNWRNALDDAIDRTLETREADLIRATLQGFTPAEIAQRWGLAPKTVSNEKTRVFQKLRAALTAELIEA